MYDIFELWRFKYQWDEPSDYVTQIVFKISR